MFPTWWLEDKPSSALLVPEIFAFAGFFGVIYFPSFLHSLPALPRQSRYPKRRL